MHTLIIKLKIPIEIEHLIGVPALTFAHWLPIGEENGISILQDEINLLLWFDIQTTWWASNLTEEEIVKHENVLAHYINAKITIPDISQQLAEYMQNRDFKREPLDSEKADQDAYDQLGQKILKILLERYNRLISYARDCKGQYWLLKYEYDPDRMRSFFQKFEGKGKIDEGNWFQFLPGVEDTIRIEITSDEKYLTESEWDAICKFVASESDHRTPLVGELLAGAEQLQGNGYNRSALTEAVTALEVAISNFKKSKSADKKLTTLYSKRLGDGNLKNQIEHMGLSGTVGYLLPLIIPESILPTDVIKGCQEAVTLRQNIVHNGQRKVDDLAVRKGILNIMKCCKILDDFLEK